MEIETFRGIHILNKSRLSTPVINNKTIIIWHIYKSTMLNHQVRNMHSQHNPSGRIQSSNQLQTKGFHNAPQPLYIITQPTINRYYRSMNHFNRRNRSRVERELGPFASPRVTQYQSQGHLPPCPLERKVVDFHRQSSRV